MYRKILGTLACALVLGAVVLAEDLAGKITKVDPDKKTITLSVDGKETEYTVADDAKLPKVGKTGEEQKEGKLKDIKDRVDKASKKNKDVKAKVKVEQKDGKDVVTEIKYDSGKTPEKKPEEKKPN